MLRAVVIALLVVASCAQDTTPAATTAAETGSPTTPTGATNTTDETSSASTEVTTSASTNDTTSEGPAADGVDTNPLCCFWASQGECNVNPFWMRPYCGRACGTPQATVADALKYPPNPPSECGPKAGRSSLPMKYRGGGGGGCRDSVKSCRQWAAMGECEKNPYWMKPHCQQSCHSCGVSVADAGYSMGGYGGNCRDSHKLCNFWASKNQCHQNPSFMNRRCAAACGQCGGGSSHSGGGSVSSSSSSGGSQYSGGGGASHYSGGSSYSNQGGGSQSSYGSQGGYAQSSFSSQ